VQKIHGPTCALWQKNRAYWQDKLLGIGFFAASCAQLLESIQFSEKAFDFLKNVPHFLTFQDFFAIL
jgi:hypothetical protein